MIFLTYYFINMYINIFRIKTGVVQQVRKARFLDGDFSMVSKIIKISTLTSKEKDQYSENILLRNQLKSLNHENVLREFGSFLRNDANNTSSSPYNLNVLVEYATRGSLSELFAHYKV